MIYQILKMSKGRSKSRSQLSSKYKNHLSLVKRIQTFMFEHSYNYVKLSMWKG
jgi:hypothetical protein